jgi:anti-sigma regulatory factor (Ser/Thr protein kinase)
MGSVCELTSGVCMAWPLPADASCAATARRLYRTAAAAVGLGAALAYDGITMASELAANTLHAAGPGGRSEFWLYLRGGGVSRELVCEVFDPSPGWSSGFAPVPVPAPPEATSGRGLQVVHDLSGGRWGHHLTRSRLGRPSCDGKVVWFALPAPF